MSPLTVSVRPEDSEGGQRAREDIFIFCAAATAPLPFASGRIFSHPSLSLSFSVGLPYKTSTCLMDFVDPFPLCLQNLHSVCSQIREVGGFPPPFSALCVDVLYGSPTNGLLRRRRRRFPFGHRY